MARHLIDPFIIDKIEQERRRREQPPAQIPLYDEIRDIPPGWEPDSTNPGGYRRKEEDREPDGETHRGVVIIQM